MRGILCVSGLALMMVASTAHAAPQVMVEHDSLSISPDGARVADVEARDPGNQPEEPHGAVFLREAGGAILAIYDPCATCKYSDTAFSPSGGLAFIATDFKTRRSTLYVAPPTHRGPVRPPERAIYAVAGYANTVRYSPDGKRIALLATVGARKRIGAIEASAAQVGEIGEQNDEQRIVVMPATKTAGDGTSRFASASDTYVYEFDWTPDGRGFAATAAKGNGDNNWWVAKLVHVDAATGAARVIASPNMQMDMPRVSPDGKTVAFIGGIMSDWGSIGGDVYTVPLAGGTPVNVTPNVRGSFKGLSWHRDTIMASAVTDDRYAAVTIDPVVRTQKIVWSAPVSARGQEFDGAIVVSADGRTAATIMQDYTHAQEIAVGRLPNLAPVTHDNAGFGANVAAQSVHWKNEGYNVQGWLIGPKQTEPGRKYPMIVIVHGGPSSSVTPRYVGTRQYGDSYDFAYDVISRGYYIFWPNDRGSYGQGEAFTRANVRDFGRGDFRDMIAGVDAVEKMAPVDDARLGLYGGSYGGWFAMWANTQTNRFKAIVAGAGISNWSSYYGQNGIDQWMIPFFGASYYDDPAVYRAASPIEFIKSAKTPTFLFVGERDVECPAPQSLEYWHGLKEMGTPVQLMIYAGEGHHFRNPANLLDLRHRIVGWFDKYLGAPPAVR